MGVEKTAFCGGGHKKSFPLKLAVTRVREESLHCTFNSRPFLSSPGPLFQKEGKCSALDMEIMNKTYFHKKELCT